MDSENSHLLSASLWEEMYDIPEEEPGKCYGAVGDKPRTRQAKTFEGNNLQRWMPESASSGILSSVNFFNTRGLSLNPSKTLSQPIPDRELFTPSTIGPMKIYDHSTQPSAPSLSSVEHEPLSPMTHWKATRTFSAENSYSTDPIGRSTMTTNEKLPVMAGLYEPPAKVTHSTFNQTDSIASPSIPQWHGRGIVAETPHLRSTLSLDPVGQVVLPSTSIKAEPFSSPWYATRKFSKAPTATTTRNLGEVHQTGLSSPSIPHYRGMKNMSEPLSSRTTFDLVPARQRSVSSTYQSCSPRSFNNPHIQMNHSDTIQEVLPSNIKVHDEGKFGTAARNVFIPDSATQRAKEVGQTHTPADYFSSRPTTPKNMLLDTNVYQGNPEPAITSPLRSQRSFAAPFQQFANDLMKFLPILSIQELHNIPKYIIPAQFHQELFRILEKMIPIRSSRELIGGLYMVVNRIPSTTNEAQKAQKWHKQGQQDQLLTQLGKNQVPQPTSLQAKALLQRNLEQLKKETKKLSELREKVEPLLKGLIPCITESSEELPIARPSTTIDRLINQVSYNRARASVIVDTYGLAVFKRQVDGSLREDIDFLKEAIEELISVRDCERRVTKDMRMDSGAKANDPKGGVTAEKQ